MGGAGLRSAGLCLMVVMLAGVDVRAASPLEPVRLQGLGDGEAVRVEPGAPALHLVFFAIWCPPCVDELARLSEFEARWNERGYRLVVVAVSTRHSRERLLEFAKAQEVPGELLFDPDGTVQAALAADELPTHLVFDASGREVLRAGEFDEGVAEVVEGLLMQGRRSKEGRP